MANSFRDKKNSMIDSSNNISKSGMGEITISTYQEKAKASPSVSYKLLSQNINQ